MLMDKNFPDVLIVGAGIFGVTAALALHHRGYQVTVMDPGPLPHPLAASTDISKVIRMEYGADEMYMAMVESALPGWRDWNELLGDKLFHEVGVMIVTRRPMAPGGFEHESYQTLLRRGHQPERLPANEIARRFPAWKPGAYVDGFYHAKGGYAESGRVVAALIRHATALGVTFHAGQAAEALLQEGERIVGLRTRSGETFTAGHVLIAAGAWTPYLVPELGPVMRASGHPVFHLHTGDTALFTPPDFTVFTADVSNTGWYGFPLHPGEGVLKIANHGVGQLLHPENDPRLVGDQDITHLRAFLATTFPLLVNAPVVYTRRCLYSDTLDGHLWIDRHPTSTGLTVAAGGSGHAFKFAPMLGDMIADAIGGERNPWLHRFRWRNLQPDTAGEEAARYYG
jgi:glycine/D-amino acid oxidase-like deaminating enzyme